MAIEWKSYAEWEAQVPVGIKSDPLWDFITYRKALFFADLAWNDCETLQKNPIARHLISQLLRSADSPSANIEEGYGRGYARIMRGF